MTSTLLRTELATVPTTSPVDAEDLRTRVQHHVDEFVSRRAAVLALISEDLRPLVDALVDLLRGGKRLRAAFCYWGWRGAGEVARPEAVAAAASLELFHAAALIHDDVMDASETRRGLPTVHRRFEARHRGDRLNGDADRFGEAAAVLLGDLCLVWSDELLHSAGLDPVTLARARPRDGVLGEEYGMSAPAAGPGSRRGSRSRLPGAGSPGRSTWSSWIRRVPAPACGSWTASWPPGRGRWPTWRVIRRPWAGTWRGSGQRAGGWRRCGRSTASR